MSELDDRVAPLDVVLTSAEPPTGATPVRPLPSWVATASAAGCRLGTLQARIAARIGVVGSPVLRRHLGPERCAAWLAGGVELTTLRVAAGEDRDRVVRSLVRVITAIAASGRAWTVDPDPWARGRYIRLGWCDAGAGLLLAPGHPAAGAPAAAAARPLAEPARWTPWTG